MQQVQVQGLSEQFQPTRPHGARRGADYDYVSWAKVSTHAPARGATTQGAKLGSLRMVLTHAPARGATSSSAAASWLAWLFQPTRPHGARPPPPPPPSRRSSFNPRARTGRDAGSISTRWARMVSTHAPARGATAAAAKGRRADGLFQPTRPHGARPAARVGVRQDLRVSTHAPARGATSGERPLWLISGVSTHAPARGATKWPSRSATTGSVFQPTRPHGARHDHRSQPGGTRRSFNPRARTGRDTPPPPPPARRSSFNPRARTGRDLGRWKRTCRTPSFNPRARTGRDKALRTRPSWSSCFNPRARTGRDALLAPVFAIQRTVSTHAPARGATIPCQSFVLLQKGFNPRARTGRDRSRSTAPDRPACFNPRARTGRDTLRRRNCPFPLQFQPTRPHGARPAANLRSIAAAKFQPTRPHGARQPHRHRRGLGRDVSTHAPARGATAVAFLVAYAVAVSTHAPARGATRRSGRGRPDALCFNPRARTGRDPSWRWGMLRNLVSTHAPARGATSGHRRGR